MVLDILKWAYRKYKPFCFLSYIFLFTCIIGYLTLIIYWMIRLTHLRKHQKHHFHHHVKTEHHTTGKSTLTKEIKTMNLPKRNITQNRPEFQTPRTLRPRPTPRPRRPAQPRFSTGPRPTARHREIRKTIPPSSRRNLGLPKSALNKRRWKKKRIRVNSWSMIDRRSSLQLDSKGNLPFTPRRDLKVEPSPRKKAENRKLAEKQIRKRQTLPNRAKKPISKDKRFLYM